MCAPDMRRTWPSHRESMVKGLGFRVENPPTAGLSCPRLLGCRGVQRAAAAAIAGAAHPDLARQGGLLAADAAAVLLHFRRAPVPEPARPHGRGPGRRPGALRPSRRRLRLLMRLLGPLSRTQSSATSASDAAPTADEPSAESAILSRLLLSQQPCLRARQLQSVSIGSSPC